jgi:hypothetical protein
MTICSLIRQSLNWRRYYLNLGKRDLFYKKFMKRNSIFTIADHASVIRMTLEEPFYLSNVQNTGRLHSALQVPPWRLQSFLLFQHEVLHQLGLVLLRLQSLEAPKGHLDIGTESQRSWKNMWVDYVIHTNSLRGGKTGSSKQISKFVRFVLKLSFKYVGTYILRLNTISLKCFTKEL